MKHGRKDRRGFTIVEVMAVVIIIGLLAAIVVKNFVGQVDKAKVKTTQASLKSLDELIMQFKMDTGRYPTEDEGLLALMEQPADVQEWPEGGYIKSKNLPKDAWGYEFLYVRYAEDAPYDVISFGADGQEGGEGYDADLHSSDL